MRLWQQVTQDRRPDGLTITKTKHTSEERVRYTVRVNTQRWTVYEGVDGPEVEAFVEECVQRILGYLSVGREAFVKAAYKKPLTHSSIEARKTPTGKTVFTFDILGEDFPGSDRWFIKSPALGEHLVAGPYLRHSRRDLPVTLDDYVAGTKTPGTIELLDDGIDIRLDGFAAIYVEVHDGNCQVVIGDQVENKQQIVEVPREDILETG